MTQNDKVIVLCWIFALKTITNGKFNRILHNFYCLKILTKQHKMINLLSEMIDLPSEMIDLPSEMIDLPSEMIKIDKKC